MRTIPVDLILHSLAECLAEHPADCAPGIYADPIARCVDHRRHAEEWTQGAGVEQHARWFVRRLSGEDMGLSPDRHIVSGDTRAIEVAVARRLADHAFAMTIEQDAEATASAATLLRAAQAVVGLATGQATPQEKDGRLVDLTALEGEVAEVLGRGWTGPVATGDLVAFVAKLHDQRDAVVSERDKALATINEIAAALGGSGLTHIVERAKHVHAMAMANGTAAKDGATREVAARAQAERGLELAREMRAQVERDLAACKAERDESRALLATIADALDTTASGAVLVDCVKDVYDMARRFDRVAKFMRAYDGEFKPVGWTNIADAVETTITRLDRALGVNRKTLAEIYATADKALAESD